MVGVIIDIGGGLGGPGGGFGGPGGGFSDNRCSGKILKLQFFYARNLILVNLILVNFFGFLVITRDHGSFGGRH